VLVGGDILNGDEAFEAEEDDSGEGIDDHSEDDSGGESSHDSEEGRSDDDREEGSEGQLALESSRPVDESALNLDESTLNLDITAMIAYVSALTNGRREFIFKVWKYRIVFFSVHQFSENK